MLGGDGPPGQVDGVEQGLQPGDFAAPSGDLALPGDDGVVMGDCR